MWLATAVLLLCGAKFILQEQITLSPALPYAWENTSLELTCSAPMKPNYTQWGILGQANTFSNVMFLKEGECEADGFLNDISYFETECYRNGSFIVRIKKVNNINHGQKWYCSDDLIRSNVAKVSVQVPTKYVTFKNISGEVINVLENMKTTLTCETSEGRPAANTTWIQVSNEGVETYMTHGAIYNVTNREISLSENNLTKVQSSIDIVPHLEDNNTRIICKASNRKHTEVKTEVTMLVQYPPDKPIFYINGTAVNDSVQLLSGSSVYIHCKSDSFPLPTYFWYSTGRTEDGPYLNLSNVDKNETWQCTSTNNITLPNKTIPRESSANITIDIFYPSEIFMFYVNGQEGGDNVEATENEMVIFNCSVKSIPKSEIVIYFAKKELRRSKYTHTLNKSLRITSCLDDGIYTCEAKNQYNSQPSFRELRLSVYCTPLLSPEFDLTTDVTCPQSETITLQFKALANPTPQFHWLKLRGSSWKSLESSTKYGIHTADKHSNLTIRDITTNEYGIYKLRIQNKIGSLEQLYFLQQDDQSIFESTTARILLVAVGTFGFIIVVGVVVAIRFCQIRRRRSDSFQMGQIEMSTDAAANQIQSIEDDNADDEHYQEINVYEHLDQQLIEGADYIEMQSIKSEDSNKYYITPIHLDQHLTESEENVEMQSIKSEDSNKYYITPIHH